MKDAYYFSHDANARNDIKIKALRKEYGIAGYGAYWVIIELLREVKDYKLPLKEFTYIALEEEVGTEIDIKAFIDNCINKYELLISDGASFWSDSLLKRMEKKDEVKNKRKQAAKKRWNDTNEPKKDANEMQMQCKSNANAMQNDAKERKGKERKVKESKVKENKDIYSDYVELAPKEYEKLLSDYGLEKTKAYIERLNDYIGQIGIKKAKSKYKSHYHVIRNWYRKDNEDAPNSKSSGRASPGKQLENSHNYDYDQIDKKIMEKQNNINPNETRSQIDEFMEDRKRAKNET